MAKQEKNEISNDVEIFELFKTSKIFLNLTKNGDNFSDESLANEFELKVNSCANYKQSLSLLKNCLSQAGLKKYQNQFKQFKYRHKHQYKSLMLKKETYDKIKMAAEEFDGVNEFLFEYLFTYQDRYLSYELQERIEQLPTPLSHKEKVKLIFHDLPAEVSVLVNEYMESIYKKGFVDGQSERTERTMKKKQDKAQESATKNYELFNVFRK